MKITVAIPTLGRDSELIETVKALVEGQSRAPDEILVIDQNQPPIDEVDRELASIRIVRHLRSLRSGVVFNMNVAVKESAGDLILFVDDDVIPGRELVARHISQYEKFGEMLGGVAGGIDQQGDLEEFRISRVGYYNRLTGAVVAHFNGRKPQKVEFGQGANMSFRKSVLLQVRGFDLGFDGNGYYFEPDVGMRVVDAGYEIRFAPEARLQHLMAPRGGCRIQDKALHTHHYVKNGIRLFRRHSPGVLVPFFVAKMFVYCSAKAFYNLNPAIFLKGMSGIAIGLKRNIHLETNLGESS